MLVIGGVVCPGEVEGCNETPSLVRKIICLHPANKRLEPCFTSALQIGWGVGPKSNPSGMERSRI
jgi:hypothetical protein